MELTNMKLKLLFIFCLTQVRHGTSKEITVIKFHRRGSQVLVKPNIGNISTLVDYTYCLRVNFWTWDQSILFQAGTHSIQLDDYLKGTGAVFAGAFKNSFEWGNYLQLSYYTWNSLCVSLQSSNIFFSINGKEVLNLTEAGLPLQIDLSTIGLGLATFTGQISDLNIWNRSLSQEEIVIYSFNCDSDFVEKSNPTILQWSPANINIHGNSAEITVIPRKNMCPQNYDAQPKTKKVIFPRFFRCIFNSKQCKNLNGEMFYPRNEKDIQSLIERAGSTLVNNECSGKFWVPFVRSATGWIHESKRCQDEDHLFTPWMKAHFNESINTPNECMYFEIRTNQFKSFDCSTSTYNCFCSFCETDEARYIFNIHSNCTTSNMDTKYFFVPAYPRYYFSGVLGKTDFVTNDYSYEWQLTVAGDSSQVLAKIEGALSDPFGIQTWNYSLCGENSMARIKMSNVSGHLNKQDTLLTKKCTYFMF
jgi:hypothetical protein